MAGIPFFKLNESGKTLTGNDCRRFELFQMASKFFFNQI